jgi:hypothetical protein
VGVTGTVTLTAGSYAVFVGRVDVTPEPSTLGLLALGGLGLAAISARRRFRQA